MKNRVTMKSYPSPESAGDFVQNSVLSKGLADGEESVRKSFSTSRRFGPRRGTTSGNEIRRKVEALER
jgi:hypothetical protein